jgi:uncharacterized protein (DUF1778 family)
LSKTERFYVRATVTEKTELTAAARAGGYASLSAFMIAAGYEKIERELKGMVAVARKDLADGLKEFEL